MPLVAPRRPVSTLLASTSAAVRRVSVVAVVILLAAPTAIGTTLFTRGDPCVSYPPSQEGTVFGVNSGWLPPSVSCEYRTRTGATSAQKIEDGTELSAGVALVWGLLLAVAFGRHVTTVAVLAAGLVGMLTLGLLAYIGLGFFSLPLAAFSLAGLVLMLPLPDRRSPVIGSAVSVLGIITAGTIAWFFEGPGWSIWLAVFMMSLLLSAWVARPLASSSAGTTG